MFFTDIEARQSYKDSGLHIYWPWKRNSNGMVIYYSSFLLQEFHGLTFLHNLVISIFWSQLIWNSQAGISEVHLPIHCPPNGGMQTKIYEVVRYLYWCLWGRGHKAIGGSGIGWTEKNRTTSGRMGQFDLLAYTRRRLTTSSEIMEQ